MLNETKAALIFENYRNAAAFSLDKSLKGINNEKIEVNYKKLTFLPDDDTINGIKSGDLRLKKVIKSAIKSLRKPNVRDENSLMLGLGMTELVNIITSNRKQQKGPAVLVFVYKDDTDPTRINILEKYLKALFREYGLNIITSPKKTKKLFKKKKEAKDRVIKFIRSNKGTTLTKKGVELKNLNSTYFDLELRSMALANISSIRDIDRKEALSCTKALIKSYSAENLRNVTSKDTCKRLAKKDKKSVDAYNELRDILANMGGVEINLPKVKYGQKKKKGKAIGRKMNDKKFLKFFRKKKNRGLLLLVYAHTAAINLGFEIGVKEYNAHMKSVCRLVWDDELTKKFITAASSYNKMKAK